MEIRTVFMGSSAFSSTILKALAAHYPISGVVSQPDKPAGRGKKLTAPPVKVLADDLGLPVFQPAKLRSPEAYDTLASWKPDVIVVSAYGQILRQNVLDLPPYGCINVHGSYLPRWRGASPIQAAIMHGDSHTGITIMKMDAGVDTGPELAKQKVVIDYEDTYYTLTQKLAEAGAALLLQTLSQYLSGEIQPVLQDENGATYAPLIKKEEGLLDFSLPAQRLERLVRAFIDWPGCYMTWEDQPLKIRKTRVEQAVNYVSGEHGVIQGFPCVGTASGALILEEVQPAGKNWMKGSDFLRGARNWVRG